MDYFYYLCVTFVFIIHLLTCLSLPPCMGAQWLSGRVLDSRPKGRGFEPHRCHCVVSLSKNINPSLVLVQPRKTRPFITEILLMGRKESNQTNKQTNCRLVITCWIRADLLDILCEMFPCVIVTFPYMVSRVRFCT